MDKQIFIGGEMIVYNKNPKDTPPIMITVTKIGDEHSDDSVSVCESYYKIGPGQGMELNLIGLFSLEEIHNFQHEKEEK